MPKLTSTYVDSAELPSQPSVIQRLDALISKDGVDNREIARIIEMDVVFTARVLRLVNSPFYGFARKITSVEEAITMLGFNSIHQLLLATSVINTFQIKESLIHGVDFWKHSFAVGVLAKYLLARADKQTQDEGFICGIMHDIGRLIQAQFDEETFESLFKQELRATHLTDEQEYFGIDHQHLGGMLATKWNFPEAIIKGISNHHTPLAAGQHKLLASAVSIADLICHGMRIGNSSMYYINSFYPESWEMLKIDFDELKGIILKATEEFDSTASILDEM